MKPRKPEGNYLTEDDLLQRLPSLLQQYGLSVSGSAPEGASMSQHTPSVPPHYELQRSSKASTDFVDVAGVTEVKVSVTLVLPGMGEYTIPCPTEHIETVADCLGSFVAWPKSLVGIGDPPVQTAQHDDFSSSKSRPILGVRPTAPRSPVQDVVDQSLYVTFGPRCRELCQWLTRTSALPTISVILNPESMLYPNETELRMRPENIREFMRREEVDQTIIIVFFRLLYDHMMELDIASVGLLCLGDYFGNDICLSLRLDRIGLMFQEYPNKKGMLIVVIIQCDIVGSSSISVRNVQYHYSRYFSLLCLILEPS
ncbi:unnamed protein product [Cuscuta campestris]|uniref:DUF8039 domain-containing protein n=1 Tax=Cuscuta campestris TaxID=132261 RepID=A0A484M6F7_9ASTE|nr:unnamed protein product [Cuscuta campestris]